MVSRLPYVIDDNKADDIYSESDLLIIKECIEKAQNSQSYPIGFDVDEFKLNFAILLAKLEDAVANKDNMSEDRALAENVNNIKKADKNNASREDWKYIVGSVIATSAVAYLCLNKCNSVDRLKKLIPKIPLTKFV